MAGQIASNENLESKLEVNEVPTHAQDALATELEAELIKHGNVKPGSAHLEGSARFVEWAS